MGVWHVWFPTCLIALSIPTGVYGGVECTIENFSIAKADGGADMSIPIIEDHLKDSLGDNPRSFVLSSTTEAIANGFGCLDSRADEPSLSAPGGDMGEFITVLAVYERSVGRPLVQFEIDSLLVESLATGQRKMFRMCTDGAALSKLCQNTGFCWEHEDLREPPEHMIDELLKRLSSPEYVGCDFLRFLLSNPKLYNIRRELSVMAIQSFYRVLWNNLSVPLEADSYRQLSSKLDIDIFEGSQEEVGMISIRAAKDCPLKTLLVTPTNEQSSIRVFYPQALEMGRAIFTRILTDEARRLDLVTTDKSSGSITEEVNAFAKAIFKTFLAQLSRKVFGENSFEGYPFYKVDVPVGCCPIAKNEKRLEADVKFTDSPSHKSARPLQLACPEGSVLLQVDSKCESEERLRIDGYSMRQVESHFQLSSGSPFEFVDAKSWGVSSVDGRNTEADLSVPGASLGQFAIALALVQKFSAQDIDVMYTLTNFVLSMQAPSFSYSADVSTLHRVCGQLKKCPSNSLPTEQRMANLMTFFRHPPEEVQSHMLQLLTEALAVSDPFLEFLLTDKWSLAPDSIQELTEDQEWLLKQTRQALKSDELKSMGVTQLGTRFGLTKPDLAILKEMFGSHGSPHNHRKNNARVNGALRQCLMEHKSLSTMSGTKVEPLNVLMACVDVYKRVIVATSLDDAPGSESQVVAYRDAVREMLPKVIRAFFNLLWAAPSSNYLPYADGIASKMDFVVLEGKHNEKAFVNVRLAPSCPVNLSPLLTARRDSSESSVWVYHEQASRQYRSGVLTFLSRFLADQGKWDENDVMEASTELVDKTMARFVHENVIDLPIYDVVVGEECCLAGEAF